MGDCGRGLGGWLWRRRSGSLYRTAIGRHRGLAKILPIQRIVGAGESADDGALAAKRRSDSPAKDSVSSDLFPVVALGVVDGGVHDSLGLVLDLAPVDMRKAKAAADHIDLVERKLADGSLFDVEGDGDLFSHGVISWMNGWLSRLRILSDRQGSFMVHLHRLERARPRHPLRRGGGVGARRAPRPRGPDARFPPSAPGGGVPAGGRQ